MRLHERLGSTLGLGPGNANISDHGLIERSDGDVDIVSVGALLNFLQNTGHLSSQADIALRDKTRANDTQIIENPIKK